MSEITRRAWLGSVPAALAASRMPAAAEPRVLYAYVGCYTSAQRYARGEGIQVYRVDSATGAWLHLQKVGDLVNPSFLVVHRSGRFLYAVHGDEAHATSFAIDPANGKLTRLNRVDTGGRNGVHLALDASGRFLAIANYSTGGVAVLPVREDGALEAPVAQAQLPGIPGPHRIEQASAHPHQILFDPSGKFLVVPDKGLDRVFAFVFDKATGKLTPTVQGAGVSRSGSGPRHAAFHPSLPVLWVLNEIHSTVVTYYWESERGHMRPAQVLPALPPDYTGESTASEIAVSPGGAFVYCSNRGHDSIAKYSVDRATGLLTSIGWTPTQGRTPRFIGFDPAGRFLYATNEQSDTIYAWRADPATGHLEPIGLIARTGSPVSIAFA